MTADKTFSESEEARSFSWLIGEWAVTLGRAVEGMGCPSPAVEIADPTDESPESDSLWWAQQISLFQQPSLWVGAAEPAWTMIGAQALHASGVEAPDTNDIRDTYREIVAQSLSAVATRLTERFGEEITCTAGEFLPALLGGAVEGFVILRLDGCEPLKLCLMADIGLVRKICGAGSPEGAASSESSAAGDRIESADPVAVAFDSVLDTELPVCVSLGSARLYLDDFLKLDRGSAIRLGLDADALYGLQVNGRVVARGELVSIRGQYGLRIQELSSRSDRLRQFDPIRWQLSLDTSGS